MNKGKDNSPKAHGVLVHDVHVADETINECNIDDNLGHSVLGLFYESERNLHPSHARTITTKN